MFWLFWPFWPYVPPKIIKCWLSQVVRKAEKETENWNKPKKSNWLSSIWISNNQPNFFCLFRFLFCPLIITQLLKPLLPLITWTLVRSLLPITEYRNSIYSKKRRRAYKTSNLPILNFTEFSTSSYAQLKAEAFYSNFKVFWVRLGSLTPSYIIIH